MKLGSLFSGCGGMDLGFERSGMECIWQVEKMPFALKILTRHWPKVPKHTDISTFCVVAGHVRTIQLQGQGKAMQEKEVDFGENTGESLNSFVLNGLSQKMSPDFSLSTMEKTFGQSYPTSIRSGIVYHGQCWTLRTSVFPNNVKELLF